MVRRSDDPPRRWSSGFPTSRGKGRDFKMSRIPDEFWERVQAKARREGVSLRSLILRALRDWVDAPPPPLSVSTPTRRRRAATKPDHD